MSDERDELAKVIKSVYWINGNKFRRSEAEVADAILAAGYRKPQQVTTVEELDALPDGSIVMDARRLCCEGLRTMGSGNVWRAMGPAQVRRSKEIPLPATVLHIGGAE